MANRLYELGAEVWLFDDEAAVDEKDVEGFRLSLLTALMLLVLAIFAGVVLLAYTQGKVRARGETPAMAAPASRPHLLKNSTISIASSVRARKVVNGPQRTLTGMAAVGSQLAPAAIAKGSPALQIGAYNSESDARVAWLAYKMQHGTLLGGYGSEVRRADLGDKGVWYRLRIVGFPSRDVASKFCERLKADGGHCFLRK